MICQGCKQEIEHFHRHHIVPKSLGGVDEDCNIAILCEPCHGKVHGRRFMNHSYLTKKGLERAKARGVKLGGHKNGSGKKFTAEEQAMGREARTQAANNKALRLKPILESVNPDRTLSFHKVASVLNSTGIPTVSGRGLWNGRTVQRVYERLENL